MIIKGENKDKLFNTIKGYFNQEEIDSTQLAKLCNEFIKGGDKLYPLNAVKKTEYKILLATGAGNTVEGGADIWVNQFLNLVWPTLPTKKEYRLLIDSKKPKNFDPRSLPKGLRYHFHFDDPSVTDEWLSQCSQIHSLHSHYHKRDHIWHWEDKFKTIFVHAYAPEMVEVIDKIPELKRLQVNTKVDETFCKYYAQSFKKRIWIGNNPSKLSEDLPNFTFNIPNFYEFKHNLPITSHRKNGKVGFASRIESRKCVHWMNELEGYLLTSQMDLKNLRDTTTYTLPKVDLYQWKPEIHHNFMLKNFGIFHGAYFKEPFGYSIFQAIDYGKIPIINKDWAIEVEYDYRASTMNEFKKMVKTIQNDSEENIQKNFYTLKEYMKQFDNKLEWADKVRTAILS